MCDPHVLGVTLLLHNHSFDYFLMRPPSARISRGSISRRLAGIHARASAADCAHVGDIAMALATVAHESYHILGYSNEAQVECYGMQSIWFVANKLGASVAGVASDRVAVRDADVPAATHRDAGVLVGAVQGRRQARPAPVARPLAQLDDEDLGPLSARGEPLGRER